MSIERSPAVWRILTLVGFEAAAVVGLHVLGRGPYVGVTWSDPSGWLAVTPADQVVVSLAWAVAVVLAWWTLASTLLYVVARVSGLGLASRLSQRLAPSVIRQAVDRALAATLVSTALLGSAAPAMAAERTPAVSVQVASATASEYEPQPAGSEAPPVSAPVPQRRAPMPVTQPDDASTGDGGKGAGDKGKANDDQAKAKAKGDKGKGDKGKRARDTAAADDGQAAAEALAQSANRAAVRAAQASEGPAYTPVPASEAPDVPEADDRRTGDAGDPGASEGTGDDGRDNDGGRADRSDRDAGGERGDRDGRGRRAGAPRPGHRYTVRVGDHLWHIAREVVAAGSDGAPRRAAVAAYWADLVREATPQLRSGDPDLIYPGERIELPPLAGTTREGR